MYAVSDGAPNDQLFTIGESIRKTYKDIGKQVTRKEQICPKTVESDVNEAIPGKC